MQKIIESLRYHYWASFRRKLLDAVQEKYRSIYTGVVLDIGGRDRGKFQKPKNAVEKWIIADISPEQHPDTILDVSLMPQIKDTSIDIITAIEVFQHVENLEKALDECFRTLTSGGRLVCSAIMTYPLVRDFDDFQHWSDTKWKKELEKRGFRIIVLESLGGYFTVIADFINIGLKSLPAPLRPFGFLFYPLLFLVCQLDQCPFVKNHPRLSNFTTGYFIIAKK